MLLHPERLAVQIQILSNILLQVIRIFQSQVFTIYSFPACSTCEIRYPLIRLSFVVREVPAFTQCLVF